MDPNAIAQLQAFVEACKANPEILHAPPLAFFKDYLTSLGGNLRVSLLVWWSAMCLARVEVVELVVVEVVEVLFAPYRCCVDACVASVAATLHRAVAAPS